MRRKILFTSLLTGIALLYACGSGGSSDSYINPYATAVNGEVKQQTITTAGYQIDGKDLSYISAFSMDNGKLVYSSALINSDGSFKINLKRDLKYSFVIFDKNKIPVLYVSQNNKNVFVIRGDTYIKIIINLNADGTVYVVDIEHDDNSILDWDDLFDDVDGDYIPDIAEQDNDGSGNPDYDEDGDGYFDGVEDNNNNGYIDGSEDSDDDLLPDPIDDDDDNDGIPDDEDND
jgi:hypothetical protein